MIAVATRFFLKLGLRMRPAVGQSVWQDSAVVAPECAAAPAYRNILTGRTVRTARYRGKLLLPLSEVLADLPVALLEAADSDAS